jgi:single-strand DNA-binding protein
MNKAILMGRLTRDPEVRYSQNNLPITTFTLAVDRRFVRQGEERQADFIPVVTFGKTAEFCEKYYRKGQQVLIYGRIQVRSWDDNEGKRRYITEIVCEEAYFADSKRQDGSARPDDFGYYPQMQDAPDSPYGMGAQNIGMGGNAPFDGGRQRSIGGDDSQGGRGADFYGSQSGGAPSGKQPSADDDGFMPIDSESDLPF